MPNVTRGPLALLLLAVVVLLAIVAWMWNDRRHHQITIDVPEVHLR